MSDDATADELFPTEEANPFDEELPPCSQCADRHGRLIAYEQITAQLRLTVARLEKDNAKLRASLTAEYEWRLAAQTNADILRSQLRHLGITTVA